MLAIRKKSSFFAALAPPCAFGAGVCRPPEDRPKSNPIQIIRINHTMTPYFSLPRIARAFEIAALIQSDYVNASAPGMDSSWCYMSVQASLFMLREGGAVVVVRGTEGPNTGWHIAADWVRNARGVPWYDSNLGWVHSGYLKGARGLFNICFEDVLAVHRQMPVGFAGHSKGGAEASILAALFNRYFKPSFVVTYGASRPGRLDALNGFDFDRLVHGRDFVPFLPPWLDHPAVSLRWPLEPVEDKLLAVQDHGIAGYMSSLEVLRNKVAEASIAI